MEYDQNVIVEATITENEFVENRVQAKKKFSLRDKGIDPLDVAILPAIIGVFVSLGFLFAGLFGEIGSVASALGL
jgi:hypothetical protein